jgi:hypothetical protein
MQLLVLLPVRSQTQKQNKKSSVNSKTESNSKSNGSNEKYGDGAAKKKNKYNPDQAMTKGETKAWRKQARRVRNRQSAAASRQRVRQRIENLEKEVDCWKRRCQEVWKRLQVLEDETTKDETFQSNCGSNH